MRICQRNGWTLAQWGTLSTEEKELWVKWDMYREHQLSELLDDVMEKNKQVSDKRSVTIDQWLQIVLSRF